MWRLCRRMMITTQVESSYGNLKAKINGNLIQEWEATCTPGELESSFLIAGYSPFLIYFCKVVTKNSKARQGPERQFDWKLRYQPGLTWVCGCHCMNSAPLELHKVEVLLWAHLVSNHRQSFAKINLQSPTVKAGRWGSFSLELSQTSLFINPSSEMTSKSVSWTIYKCVHICIYVHLKKKNPNTFIRFSKGQKVL